MDGEEIVTTAEHPFYRVDKDSDKGNGFVGAKDLKPGDQILLLEGITGTVEEAFKEELTEPVKVYNFEVKDYHTYFVGEQGVLVHNLCKGGRKVPNPYGKKGGPSHRSVVESITPKSAGNLIDTEVKIDTTGGYKTYRYADAIEYNKEGKVIAIYQVGKVNKNGTVIPRESRAIEDIMSSDDYRGVPVYFLPYNSDIGEIIFDY
ncbi:MAG TPA: hypothetical protein DCY81_03530 [Lachnospiraceae bacterium]|nr:hypothetical protein [Lachnospiraceae bacterium]